MTDRVRLVLRWSGLGILVVGLLVVFVLSYLEQRESKRTVMVKFETDRKERLRNLQIFLNAQQPREPVFDGELLVNLEDTVLDGKTLTIFREPVGTYARERQQVKLVLDEGVLRTGFIKMAYPTVGHNHSWFPFDSSSFDLSLTFQPNIPVEIVRIRNSVPGFALFQESVLSQKFPDGRVRIAFKLRRYVFTQALCTLFLIAALFFAPLIISTQTSRNLVGSVAGIVISLWSFRGILSFMNQIQTFPTLLDYGIMVLSGLVLGWFIWRITVPNVRKSTKN